MQDNRPANLQESGYFSALSMRFIAVLLDRLATGSFIYLEQDYDEVSRKYGGSPIIDIEWVNVEGITIGAKISLKPHRDDMQEGVHYIKTDKEHTDKLQAMFNNLYKHPYTCPHPYCKGLTWLTAAGYNAHKRTHEEEGKS
jgi:hypothetical protein